jgi:hypothetical protein
MANISDAPLALAAALIGVGFWAPAARAQQRAQGFAVERFRQAAPGSGWFVMDDLGWHGGLGGAVSLTVGYAHRPLRVTSPDGTQSLDVVQHDTFASVALAVTYDRFRFHAIFSSPLYIAGQSGTLGEFSFTGPEANLEKTPDSISDVQLGAEARLYGEPAGPLRLGASAQLFVPSGDRVDYVTDNTYRAAARVLVAGDAGRFAYAGHAGVHIRPLDEPAPGSPRGSELLFGLAGGMRLPLLDGSILLGPEIFGATAFRSFFGGDTTAAEGLLSATFERPGQDATGVRIKLGVGAGLHPRFGAPQFRAVIGVELLCRFAEERARP